jgi:ribosomal protein L40E
MLRLTGHVHRMCPDGNIHKQYNNNRLCHLNFAWQMPFLLASVLQRIRTNNGNQLQHARQEKIFMTPQTSPQVSSEKRIYEDEVQVSYFVKKRKGSPSRLCEAKLLDISNAGLCMEISPEDSEIYMESGGQVFLLNRSIDIQIFCRSHPNNVSVEGYVKWLQREEENEAGIDPGGIRVGVLFSFDNADQRWELAELVSLLKTDTTNCRECNAPVSADAPLCYNCGSKLVRRRAFLRKILDNLLAGDKAGTHK